MNGSVGKNSVQSIIASIDDTLFLRGVLKDNDHIKEELVKSYPEAEGKRSRSKRQSVLGGDNISFQQFWFLFANLVMKYDVITFSLLSEGKRLQQQEAEESQQRAEAARLEEERLQQKDAEYSRLLLQYQELHPKLQINEALKSILDAGKTLTGDFLKPTDDAFQHQVLPHGPHIPLLSELLTLLGLQTDKAASLVSAQIVTRTCDSEILFRSKVQHDVASASQSVVSKKNKTTIARRSVSGIHELAHPKDERLRKLKTLPELNPVTDTETPAQTASEVKDIESKPEGRWWDSELMEAWMILQDIYRTPKDGFVTADVLQQVLVSPKDFIQLRKKVEDELEHQADGAGEDSQGPHKRPSKARGCKKPGFEVLSQRLHLTVKRLEFLHELFETFLEPDQDGQPATCEYPDKPAAIGKVQMFSLLRMLNPNISEAEFDARFRRIDEDRSGKVEFDEFATWIHEDQVQCVGTKSKKMTLQDLASCYDQSLELIQYIHHCFQDELPDVEVDNYPVKPGRMPKQSAWMLAGILTPSLSQKEFEANFQIVDVRKLGVIEFDEFLELLNFHLLPTELREKYANGNN